MVFHRQRTSKSPQDGLHYQQQVILRNATTPGVALWQFVSLFSWRKLSRRPFWRSLPLIVTALVILTVFFASGILVSEVTRTAGSEVLVHSDLCGNWTLVSENGVFGFQTKSLNDTINAASYARSCYGGPSNGKALECNQYQSQTLPYTTSNKEACPFADEMCGSEVFTLDTGKLSSHDHLGINSKFEDRISYRRKTTCAPLEIGGFRITRNYTDDLNDEIGDLYGLEGDVVDLYAFGSVMKKSKVTFAYNRHASSMGHGYDLQ